jgi:hypothetical protein
MSKLSVDLIVDVTLYPTSEGGRSGPLRGDLHPWFGCPCKIQKDDHEAWDARLLIDGVVIEPGETRRLGVAFLSREQAVPIFAAAAHFFLWEGRIIGEARVIDPLQRS